ncbi:MAG TPA: DUF2802 domain-containing protein [Steroidobacteraceae bacterium]|jgi:hypothetical protein|nr:DUF2802 domain-containing protein [Steroidobacteraceae bacterium]
MSLPAAELTSVEFLLVAGRAVFLLFSFVVAAFAFTSWRRAIQVQTAQVLSQTNTVLQRLASLEARVDATKTTISQLGDRLERPALPPTGNGPSASYQMAIRLAKGGASREELMAGCGLSLAEAELVRRLHGSSGPVRS